MAVRGEQPRRQRAVDASRKGPSQRHLGDLQGRIVLRLFVERRAVRAERHVQPVRRLRDLEPQRRLHGGRVRSSHAGLRQGEERPRRRYAQPEADGRRNDTGRGRPDTAGDAEKALPGDAPRPHRRIPANRRNHEHNRRAEDRQELACHAAVRLRRVRDGLVRPRPPTWTT